MMAIMVRQARKVDANQGDIVDAMRAVGAFVQSMADLGDGCPDLLVCWRGHWIVIEVKVPGELLNPRQKKWHIDSGGRVHVARDVNDAMTILGGYAKVRNPVLVA